MAKWPLARTVRRPGRVDGQPSRGLGRGVGRGRRGPTAAGRRRRLRPGRQPVVQDGGQLPGRADRSPWPGPGAGRRCSPGARARCGTASGSRSPTAPCTTRPGTAGRRPRPSRPAQADVVPRPRPAASASTPATGWSSPARAWPGTRPATAGRPSPPASSERPVPRGSRRRPGPGSPGDDLWGGGTTNSPGDVPPATVTRRRRGLRPGRRPVGAAPGGAAWPAGAGRWRYGPAGSLIVWGGEGPENQRAQFDDGAAYTP